MEVLGWVHWMMICALDENELRSALVDPAL